jgi:hypothetical protein
MRAPSRDADVQAEIVQKRGVTLGDSGAEALFSGGEIHLKSSGCSHMTGEMTCIETL